MFKKIYLTKEKLDWINNLLTHEPKTEDDCFGEDETFSVTAKFPDGYEMDVKLCGVQYLEGQSNLPWTEAVLFFNGSQVAYTEPAERFEGIWTLNHDGNNYTVLVSERR